MWEGAIGKIAEGNLNVCAVPNTTAGKSLCGLRVVMESTKMRIVFSLLPICGIIISAWGVNWARWSEFRPISHYINLHATRLFAAGIGLLCWLVINHSLLKRIEGPESAMNQMKGEK
jgi:hypothetical protein